MTNILKKLKLYFYLFKYLLDEICLYRILYHDAMNTAGSDFLLFRKFNKIKRSRFYRNASKIVIYGAGKHTARILNSDLLPSTKITAMLDDDKNKTSFMGFPVYPLERLSELDFDLLIVSSDVYEEKMYRTAIKLIPPNKTIVKIYKFEFFFSK